jgi:hypothetical protein
LAPRDWGVIHRGAQGFRDIPYHVIHFAEALVIQNPLLLARYIAGADQLPKNALQLFPANPESAPDMIKPNLPLMGAGQQKTEHALSLDRQTPVEEHCVWHDCEMGPVLAANDGHR